MKPLQRAARLRLADGSPSLYLVMSGAEPDGDEKDKNWAASFSQPMRCRFLAFRLPFLHVAKAPALQNSPQDNPLCANQLQMAAPKTDPPTPIVWNQHIIITKIIIKKSIPTAWAPAQEELG